MRVRKLVLQFILFFVIAITIARPAYAGIEQVSEEEFRALSTKLAPKVNLFRDAWEKDPAAVFYGGTSRDYLYWIKGKFLNAKTREQALAVKKQLENLPSIDVRDFIIGESDVDVISKKGVAIDAGQYGVRKIDSIKPDVFDPETELGQNELWQGHIPVEKIQITNGGIQQNPVLGDGLHEIYTGKLTVHYAEAEKFAQTKFARDGVNHPVLLALRYLRLQGINYFKTYGAGLPRKDLLFTGFDEASRAETKKIIDQALNSQELKPFLNKKLFASWMNGTIQKSFRSYTNPTAALEILKAFSVDKFSSIYGADSIESIYQYVFAKHRDQAAIEKAMKDFRVDTAKFFENPAKRFTDGFLYHGTRDERSFRSILFQGVLPSESGVGEKGLYGVALHNKKFSEEWGGDKDRLIQFPVKPNARIVDVTYGEGKRVFQAFGQKEDAFAEAFGVDIVRYPYNTEAFVVKNSESLGRPQGVYRRLITFSELLEQSHNIRNPHELLQTIAMSSVTATEAAQILDESVIPNEEMAKAVENLLATQPDGLVQALSRSMFWKKYGPNFTEALLKSKDGAAVNEAIRLATESLKDTDLWKKYGTSLADELLKRKFGTATEMAIRLLEGAEFPITQNTFNALLQSGSARAVKKAMGLLEEGKFSYDDNTIKLLAKVFDDDLGEGVLEPLLRQQKWDLLEKIEENVTAKGSSRIRGVDYLIFLRHMRRGEKFDLHSNHANYKNFVAMMQKYVLPNVNDKMAGPLAHYYSQAKLNSFLSDETDFYPLFQPYIESSRKYPQIFDGVLEGYLKNSKVMNESELKALRSKLKPGWSADAASLKLVKKALGSNIGAIKIFTEMLVPLLTLNGGYEKDPGFFELVMQNAKLEDVDAISHLLQTPNLAKNSRALHTVVLNSLGKKKRYPALVRFFSTEEAAKYPQTLLELAKSNWDATPLFPALESPAWKDSPEVLEAFALYLKGSEWKKNNGEWFQSLLDLPHWRDNPAFADLKKNGKIDLDDFYAYAKQKNSLGARVGRLCSGLFGGLGGKK